MLSVVPQRRGGVAVVVAHRAEGPYIRVFAANLCEAVHQTAVKGKLLVTVAVIFVARRTFEILRAVIVFLGVRISSKIMVERNVLLKNNNDVFDWRLR